MKRKLLLLSMLAFAWISNAQEIVLEEFATGFNSPVEMVNAGDERFFVVEQDGMIRIVHPDGSINSTPFLNIGNMISTGGERGLLGLAFHPDYETNGYFFVNYTNPDGNTVIARFTRNTTNPDIADATSQTVLMTIDQPYPNHNGGCLRFGPDGYLYIAMGDGGSGGDPQNRAQNTEVLLGKMLRIDVNGASPYSIPAGNPFVGVAGADEIWAYGLRNPWKFSFNRTNGDLWIADVGQGEIEEINNVASGIAGLNYGWRCYEGNSEFNTSQCSDVGIYTMPIAQYTHSGTNGCSITGGYVYTGSMYPNLQDKYLFADYCNNKIGILDAQNNITYTEAFGGNNFTLFGEDMNGELYIGGQSSGTIYKITDASMGTKGFEAKKSSLYPNPAVEEVYVSLKNQQDATVQIFDLGGKSLINKTFTGESGRINTSSLQSGIYMVEVRSASGTDYHKLVIR